MTGIDGSTGQGLGWVDIGRRHHGDVDGPYTWWSSAARRSTPTPAGASTTTWRRPALAARVTDYRVVRAPSWDTRWSDHAPVVADYAVGR